VDLCVGSSGFSYDFWKGPFYPSDIDADEMLSYYAMRFRTVEINNTFYRMPKAAVLSRWAVSVPDDFRFAIKASRRITHDSRLEGTADNVAYLYRQLEALGDTLGCVLFQCPPQLRKNVDTLRGFFATLPEQSRAVMEFRHPSWLCDEVYEVLAAHRVVLCASDEDGAEPPLRPTADFGYLRLRDEVYDDATLLSWRDRLASVWPRAYVFFKHEEGAPAAIARMVSLAPSPSPTT
jgi:uncharacterized protein YecE (DUF72 family)